MIALVAAAVVAASPLSFSDDRFAFILVGEIDYRAQSSDVEGLNGVTLATFRFGGRLQPLPWLRVVGVAEWATDKPLLNDALIELFPLWSLTVRVGYGKTPLFPNAKDVFEEALPLPFQSLVVRSFWPRRDLGVELQWQPWSLPVETWLRFGNGSNSVLGNDNVHPSVDGRVDVVLGREHARADPTGSFGARFGLGAHVEDAFDRTGIGGTTAQGFLFYRPPVVSGPRVVVEGHAQVGLGPLRVLIDAATAWENRTRDTDGNPSTPREALPRVQARGLAAEVSWVIRGLPRVGNGPPAPPPVPEGTLLSGGSVEVSGRFERVWLGLGAPDVQPGGAVGGALAARWWVNEFLAATLAANVLRFDQPPLEEPGRDVSWLVLGRLTVRFR